MSTPGSAPSRRSSGTKSRKKPPADVVSFEDLLAAHKTDRGPGQLPAEGVVLIGVDLELQRRMAERLTMPQAASEANISALKFGALSIPESIVNNQEVGPVESTVGAPEIAALKLGAENFSAPQFIDTGTVLPQLAYPPEVTETAPEFSAPNFGASDFSAPKSGAPNTFDVSQLLVRRSGRKTYTIHPVHRIEDSLTPAERDLLKWLWEKGRPLPNNPRLRLATGSNGEGARRLAAQAGLIYNTFKNLTRSLAAKFAVDIVKPEKNLPAVYVIYHFSTILDRQRQAGFTGVMHKNGGGRELVTASAQPACPRPDLSFTQLEEMLSALNFGAPNSISSAPTFTAGSGNFGAPKIEAPIRNNKYTSFQEHTTTATVAIVGAPMIVIEALFERTGRSDGEAARMILKGCVEANSSIQPAEVARLIRTFHIPANIANPVGLLIRTLPNHCTPESIGNYREQWRKADEQEHMRQEQQRHETIETARGVMDGVSKGEKWDEDTVEWAQSVLREAGK